MLIKILIGLAVLLVGLVIVIALRPSDFRVTRSAKIAAPAAVVFAQVNDFHLWNAWSPWAKLDPEAKNVFDGPASGRGAGFAWDGNREVGAGRMTITDSRAPDVILIKIEFKKPFEGSNDIEFTFKPDGDKTLVTWTMSGKNNFIGKAIGLFMDCDAMCGGMFEKGLANLEEVSKGK